MACRSLARTGPPVDFLLAALAAAWLAAAPAVAQGLDPAWQALEAGDHPAARAAAETARAAAGSAADRWQAELMLARIDHHAGADAASLERLRGVVAQGRTLWPDDPAQLVEPLMMLGYALSATGEATAGLAASAEALRLARLAEDGDLAAMALDALVRDLLNVGDPAAAEVLAAELVILTAEEDPAARLLLAIARADLGAPERALAAVLPLLPPDPAAEEDIAALWQELSGRLDAAAAEAEDPAATLDRWFSAAPAVAAEEAAAADRAMTALGAAMAARGASGALAFDRAARDRLADLPPGDALVQAADLALLVATLAEGRPDLAVTWAERVAAVPAPVLATRTQDMLPPLREVAEWLHSEGRLPQALRLAEAVAVLSPLRDGPGSEAVGRALVLLAAVQTDMGRLAEAGATLDLLQDGAGHSPRIAVLARLEQAALHGRAGRADEALAALQAALRLLETTPEGDRPDAWLRVLGALAEHHAAEGDPAAALAAAERLLAEVAARAAPGAPETAEAARRLARHRPGPVPALPEPAARRGLSGGLPAGAGLSPDVAPLVEAAQALRAQGDLDQAIARMDAALGRLPADHPVRAALLAGRGLMRLEAGQPLAALEDLRPATAELSQPDRRDEAFSRQALAIHVAAAMAAAGAVEGVALLNLLTEAFQVAQRVNDLRAGEVLGRATARLYGEGELGRAHEAAAAGLAAAQAAMVQALAEGRDGIAERARLTRARAGLAAAEARLAERFPDYGAFAAARPVDLLATSRLLRPDEALLLFATVEGDAVPGRVFAITRDDFDSAELPPRAELEAIARRLRCAAALTDPACAGAGAGGTRGAFSLDAAEEEEEAGFDPAPALAAWQALLAPVAGILEGKPQLIVVPDRALVALPFHLIARGAGGGEIDWLIRDHAITVMPNVAGLARLRDREARPVAARRPFLGIGDPLIGAARAGPLPYDCAAPPDGPLPAALPAAALARGAGGLADPARLADLPALPDTRCELERAARLYGTPDALLLHGQATEARLKALSAAGDLADYRVLSFATHGLIAGELGAGDAALVLTPPRAASADDDGLLTAAEIALLRLDADLVILSACNTAAGSGEGGEGLSGLASGFFLAGARSLLVSHWPVWSDAATRLTEAMLAEAARSPGLPRAEALRRAMLSLADAPGADARQRHPAYWAPFLLVGEGG